MKQHATYRQRMGLTKFHLFKYQFIITPPYKICNDVTVITVIIIIIIIIIIIVFVVVVVSV